MRSVTLFILLLTFTGCASPKGPASAQAQRRNIIDVGQSWADAKAAATRANYSFHDEDPIGVERVPQPAGFVLTLDRDFDLYVIRNKATETVEALQLVSNPGKSKKWRASLDLESFVLPPAPKD